MAKIDKINVNGTVYNISSGWTGTRAEWGALSIEEKGKLEGLPINIIDDHDYYNITERFTQEEWEDMTAEQRESLDGKLVVIEDDYESNICSSVDACNNSTNVNDVAGASAISSLTTYSTDEQRVGTWINGKPIYRKVFIINQSDWVNNAYNLSLPYVDYIVSYGGSGTQTNSNGAVYSFPFPRMNSEAKYCYYCTATDNNKNLYITRGDGFSSVPTLTLYVILEYTKTTDPTP